MTLTGSVHGMPGPVKKIGQGPGDRLDVFSSFLKSQQVHRTVAVDGGIGHEEVGIAMLIVGKGERARRKWLAIGLEGFLVERQEQIQPHPAGSAGLIQIEITTEQRL